MQRRNIVGALVLSIVFTAGCAVQDTRPSATSGASRETKRGTEPYLAVVIGEFSAALDASVGVTVECVSSTSICLPYPDPYVTVTKPGQKIVFNLLTPDRYFESAGVKFADDTYKCDAFPGNRKYTCTPNDIQPPPPLVFLKYTIKVYGAVPHDPYAFVKN